MFYVHRTTSFRKPSLTVSTSHLKDTKNKDQSQQSQRVSIPSVSLSLAFRVSSAVSAPQTPYPHCIIQYQSQQHFHAHTPSHHTNPLEVGYQNTKAPKHLAPSTAISPLLACTPLPIPASATPPPGCRQTPRPMRRWCFFQRHSVQTRALLAGDRCRDVLFLSSRASSPLAPRSPALASP